MREYTIREFVRLEAREKRTPTRAAGEGPAVRGSTRFGSLGRETCEKRTPLRKAYSTRAGRSPPGPYTCEKRIPTRAAGEGPAARRSTQFRSLGLETC